MPEHSHPTQGPASLVAIAQAARLAGDRDMEREAKQQLRERYGIELRFRRQATTGGDR